MIRKTIRLLALLVGLTWPDYNVGGRGGAF